MFNLRSLKDADSLILNLKSQGQTIGFVPTMGALHQGHISLVERSKKENDFTFVSIFVNPTQFNNSQDLTNYPRSEELDIKILEDAGADAVFFPTVEMMYPDGEKSESMQFDGLENKMEGKFRAGHFEGVATVVKRFFELIQPTNAYFGEKDFQQLQIIRHMVKEFKIPVNIIPVSIKREEDGLAMSSRNQRLSPEMRKEVPQIYKILQQAKSYFENHSTQETQEFVKRQFDNSSLELEYFEIADEETLVRVEKKDSEKKLRAFIAVYANDIRLIDNLKVN